MYFKSIFLGLSVVLAVSSRCSAGDLGDVSPQNGKPLIELFFDSETEEVDHEADQRYDAIRSALEERLSALGYLSREENNAGAAQDTIHPADIGKHRPIPKFTDRALDAALSAYIDKEGLVQLKGVLSIAALADDQK